MSPPIAEFTSRFGWPPRFRNTSPDLDNVRDSEIHLRIWIASAIPSESLSATNISLHN